MAQGKQATWVTKLVLSVKTRTRVNEKNSVRKTIPEAEEHQAEAVC